MLGARFEELQRTVHSARLVAVHAAADAGDTPVVSPTAAAECVEPILIGRIIELPVFRDIETRGQALNYAHHIAEVAAPSVLLSQPRLTFGICPRGAGFSDGRCGGSRHDSDS